MTEPMTDAELDALDRKCADMVMGADTETNSDGHCLVMRKPPLWERFSPTRSWRDFGEMMGAVLTATDTRRGAWKFEGADFVDHAYFRFGHDYSDNREGQTLLVAGVLAAIAWVEGR